MRAANVAVAAGLDFLLTLLADPDQDRDLRLKVLSVIMALPTCAAESVPRLRALLTETADAVFRMHLAYALHDLMDDGPEAQQCFRALLMEVEPVALPFIGAVGLLTRARAEAPEPAVQHIMRVLGELGAWRHHDAAPPEERQAWEEATQRYAPDWGGYALRYSVAGLSAQGLSRGHAALGQALRLQRDRQDAEDVALALLELVFPIDQRRYTSSTHGRDPATGQPTMTYGGGASPPAHMEALTSAQRTALQALVAHDPLWEHRSNLLERYGLPPDRAALRALLREDPEGGR